MELDSLFEDSVIARRHNGYILLFNREEGSWIKLSEKLYNNVCWYFQNNEKIDDRYNALLDELNNKQMLKAANRNKKLENVAVMLTNRCNLSCKHCCASQIISEKDISFDIVRKVVELNPHQICITGGEPLLYKNIEEVLKFIKKHYNGKLLLATNGLLVNKYIDMIVKYFDKVEISIDGLNNDETSRYRERGVFKCVLDAVKMLKDNGLRVAISLVTYDGHETEEFNKLNEEYGTVPILRSLFINDRVIENIDKIIPGGEEQYIKVMKEVIENQEQDEKLCTCGSVSYQILIDSEGYVYPCGGLAEEDFKIGNILVDDISDLVKYHSGKYYGEIISKMLSNEKFSKCRNCIVREFCWTCLSEVLSKSMYNEVFEAFCDMNYKKWNKIVWENKGKK